MHKSNLILIALAVGLATVSLVPLQAADPKLLIWEKASTTYNTAMKQYKLGDWKKAESTLNQFITSYPGNEHVPLAYLQMVHCRRILKDNDGAMAALNELIKKFPDSKAAMCAFGYKIDVLRGENKLDEALAVYEQVGRMLTRAPLSIYTRIDWRNWKDYYWRFGSTSFQFPHYRRIGYSLNVAPGLGWVGRLVQIGNTPERAEKVLDAMGTALKFHGDDLPADWKFAHVLLLRKMEEAKDDQSSTEKRPAPRRARRRNQRKSADEQYKHYLESWPDDDPRRMGFLLLEAEYLLDHGKAEQAGKLYDQLIQDYPKYGTLGEKLPKWMDYLYKKGRVADYTRYAQYYLTHYPLGGWRDAAIQRLVNFAEQQGGEHPEQIKAARQAITAEEKTDRLNPLWMRRALLWKISLLRTEKKIDQAVKQATELASDAYWSNWTWSQINALAKADKAFQRVVEEARKKYTIPQVRDDSPVKPRLEELKRRIKDDQVRHMEEIGQELVQKHPKDALTIQAVKMLVDYFYKKVLVEQRNKWVSEMMSTWPYHPLTQAVVNRQISAIRGAKLYPQLGELTAWAMKHFPGATHWNRWYSYHMESYTARKDSEGAARYAHRLFDARAKIGEIWAIRQVGRWETHKRGGPKDSGQFWLGYAKQFAGRPAELVCWRQAFHHQYLAPASKWHWKTIAWAGTVQSMQAMARQAYDPELAWKVEFDDINMYSQGGFAKQAVLGLAEQLKSGEIKHPFRLHERLDLPNLGRAIGSAKLTSQAAKVLRVLKAKAKSKSDQYYIELMLAIDLQHEQQFVGSAKFYIKSSDYPDWPINRWPNVMQAGAMLRSAKSPVYVPTLAKYLPKIKTAQDVVPRLLWMLASWEWNHGNKKRAATFITALRKNYKSSGYRGNAEKMIRK